MNVPHRNRKAAFSLIELLVVISVVAIIAAMLMPALRQARDSARASVCTSNLRQLGLAMQAYLDDHGRYFPYFTNVGADRLWYFGMESPFNASGAPGTRMIDLTQAKLFPYFRTQHGIEVCPSYDYRSPRWRQKYNQITAGYGLNFYLFDLVASGVTQPSRRICFADSAQVNTFQAPASVANPMIEEWYYVEDVSRMVQFRHGARANVLFCDSHVESLPMAAGTLDTRLPGAQIGRLNPNGDSSLFR